MSPPVQFTVPPAQAEAVKVALLPAQIVELLLVMVGVVGFGLTVMVTATLESLLQALMVQSTLYVFVLLGFTVILPPESPSVHERVPLLQADAVRVTDSPKQMVVLLATTVGVAGLASTVTVTAVLESLLKPLMVHKAL